MTPKRIAELRALCEAATPGPWETVGTEIDAPTEEVVTADCAPCGWSGCSGARVEVSGANADFIVQARTALPEALDEIERLQGEPCQCNCSGCFHCQEVDKYAQRERREDPPDDE